jgi:hypothetical protein
MHQRVASSCYWSMLEKNLWNIGGAKVEHSSAIVTGRLCDLCDQLYRGAQVFLVTIGRPHDSG